MGLWMCLCHQPSDTPCPSAPNTRPAIRHHKGDTQALQTEYIITMSVFPVGWQNPFWQVRCYIQILHSGFQHPISGTCVLCFILKITMFSAWVQTLIPPLTSHTSSVPPFSREKNGGLVPPSWVDETIKYVKCLEGSLAHTRHSKHFSY